jgi:hypothetical protein
MSKLALVRPANDPAAVELASWSSWLIPDIAASSHSHSDLHGSAVTRAAVEADMSASRVTLFFGHGFKSRLQGYTSDVLDLSNISKSWDRIVVAIACWSAVTLGPAAISAGADAYLGFDEAMVWLTGDPDKRFGPAATSGVRKMITSGSDIAACATTMKSEFDSVFAFYKTGAGSGSPNAVLGWLAADWDKQRLTQLGTSTTTI